MIPNTLDWHTEFWISKIELQSADYKECLKSENDLNLSVRLREIEIEILSEFGLLLIIQNFGIQLRSSEILSLTGPLHNLWTIVLITDEYYALIQ